MDTINVPIKGMHCRSCTILVGEEISKIPCVKHVNVSLKRGVAIIKYSTKPTDSQLRRAIENAGYEMAEDNKSLFNQDTSSYTQFLFNFVILVILFYLLSKSGLVNLNFNTLSGNSGIMALVVGLTAGFSTCMALVGGLVFGLSARFAEKHPTASSSQKFTPHLLFNLGRIVTFFILGGVIGTFGGIFKLNGSITGILTIIIGFVMIFLGIQLTEIFPRLTNRSFTLPASLAKKLGMKKHQSNEYSHKSALILGGLSFFLPCGFTQAMQLVAIGTGNFIGGAIVMGMFAIGTAPGLLTVGGITSVVKGKFAQRFFRFAGVLVIALAGYNIWNGYNLLGYRFSLDSFNGSNKATTRISGPVTTLKTTFTLEGDISQKTFNVKSGQPYVLEVDARDDGQGCMSTIMIPGVYDTPILIKKGIVKLEFVIDRPGIYQITCAMGIVRGTINAS